MVPHSPAGPQQWPFGQTGIVAAGPQVDAMAVAMAQAATASSRGRRGPRMRRRGGGRGCGELFVCGWWFRVMVLRNCHETDVKPPRLFFGAGCVLQDTSGRAQCNIQVPEDKTEHWPLFCIVQERCRCSRPLASFSRSGHALRSVPSLCNCAAGARVLAAERNPR